MMADLQTIEARVDNHAKTLDSLQSDVRDLRQGQQQSALELVRIQSDVKALGNDVRQLGQDFKTSQKEILAEQEERRQREYAELKETLSGRTITFKDRITFIVVPLFVAVIGAIVLIVTTLHHG